MKNTVLHAATVCCTAETHTLVSHFAYKIFDKLKFSSWPIFISAMCPMSNVGLRDETKQWWRKKTGVKNWPVSSLLRKSNFVSLRRRKTQINLHRNEKRISIKRRPTERRFLTCDCVQFVAAFLHVANIM